MELLIDNHKVLIDVEDWQRVKGHRWWVRKNGKHLAVCATIQGRRVYLHHFVMPRKPGFLTGHLDQNPLNCRKANLRYATRSQTCANSRGRSNPSGYRGVSKWVVDGRSYYRVVIRGEYVGSFTDAEEAARAYDQKAIELYGEFAVLNFASSRSKVQ